jgi:hypothetical protein
MKTFNLVGKKTKEVITKTQQRSIQEAVQYFSKMKSLKIDLLLSIYEVVEN